MKYIKIHEIETEGLQTRAEISNDTANEYAEAERDKKAVFPPVVVFSDGKRFFLADGFHRVAAARKNMRKTISADVRKGGKIDALRYALSANDTHGARRTNEDKRHAVKMAYDNRAALGLPDVPSARAVADLCGVDHKTATSQLGNFPTWANAQNRTGKDGKSYPVPEIPPAPPVYVAPEVDDKPEPDEVPPEYNAEAVAKARQIDEQRKAARKVTAAHSEPPQARTEPPDPACVDCRGKPIPSNLRELWTRRREMAKVADMIAIARRQVEAAHDGKDPLYLELGHQSVLAHLNAAYGEIKQSMPFCVCPLCHGHGAGCMACKERGLMGKFRFEQVVPKELK